MPPAGNVPESTPASLRRASLFVGGTVRRLQSYVCTTRHTKIKMEQASNRGPGHARVAAVIWSPILGVFAVRAGALGPRRGRVIWSVSSPQQKRPDSRLTRLTCGQPLVVAVFWVCHPHKALRRRHVNAAEVALDLGFFQMDSI